MAVMSPSWTLVARVVIISFFLEYNPTSAAPGTYTVVAPRVLRPGLPYYASVSMQGTLQPVIVTASLGGVSVDGRTSSQTSEVILDPGETQIVQFQIGEWGPGNYNLTVSGSGGLSFTNTTKLEFQHKSYSVFIQTDKPIYKPAETVHFRCVVVNPTLRPTLSGIIDVLITDGQRNRVKQWSKVSTSKGVFSEKLKLSDQPVLGDWNVTVKVSGQLFSKSFTVMEYVLPTFDVSLRLPPYALFNDTSVVASVRATYTYGKPVKGEVALVLSPTVHSPIIQVWLTPPVRKTESIDGVADVRLNLGDLNLQEDYQRDIKIEAVVTEALTGERHNTSGVLSLFRHRVKLELVPLSDTFKPGLRFTALLKVAYQDDIPVNDNTNPVIIRLGYNYNESSHQERRLSIPRNGIIRLDLYPPNDPNANVLVITAEYREVKQYFPGIERSLSPSNNYIQVLLLSDTPKVKDEVEVEVNATEPLESFVYQVVGRGNVVVAQTVHVNREKVVRFKVTMTSSMAPTARLLVFYVRQDGEVVADSIQFDVIGAFQTPVSILVSTNETQPGNQVDVRVNTKAGAYVGILGVDQSVLLLKTGNDITQADVIDELQTYDAGSRAPEYGSELMLRYIWSPGTVTAQKVFEDAGMVIISNGHVFQHYPRSGGSSTQKPVAVQRSSPESSRMRKDIKSDATYQLPDGDVAGVTAHEPWLWDHGLTGPDGSLVVKGVAPDTITSWIVSAFAVDQVTGLGVAPSVAKVSVFRPFFIALNLPYSIIRGESVGVQVVVFNYQNQDVDATVILKGNENFDFVNLDGSENEVLSSGSQRQKKVNVKANDGATVTFMVSPRSLGYIDIEVSAQSAVAGDRVLKKLLVKPEGTQLNFNRAILVDLRQKNSFSQNVKVDIPNYAVPGSQYVEVSTIADILGPAINNLDQLLQMPFGCGEQNMLNFVPNIVVAEYLRNSNLLTDDLKAKIIANLEAGYQRELTYKRVDGSFSAFGNTDKNGSTWLTAFVVKSFRQAKKYITVDDRVIAQSLNWLVSRQAPDGSFPEVGTVSHKAMQGGAADGLALTAYVMIALLENDARASPSALSAAVQKGLLKMQDAVAILDDTYALSIVTYALHLAESPAKELAFNRLLKKVNNTGEMRFWLENAEDKDSVSGLQARSVDVEQTGYALMSHVLRGDVEGSIAIMRWMVAQMNQNGGFASTQDTVIGIQSLATLARRIITPTSSMEVVFTFEGAQKSVALKNENRMILHKLTLPSETRQVSIAAKGSGFAIVQVSYSYNLNVTQEKPAFRVNPLVDTNSNRNLLVINSCASYMLKGSSNMAVMEVRLPSGYTVDQSSLPALLKGKFIKRVETKEGDSLVVIYFDKLSSEEVCPTIKAYRTYKVAKQKPTAVRLYDYYDLGRSARSFYQAVPATLCDICENETDGDCDRQVCAEGNFKGDKIRDASKSPNTSTSSFNIICWTLFTVLTISKTVTWCAI